MALNRRSAFLVFFSLLSVTMSESVVSGDLLDAPNRGVLNAAGGISRGFDSEAHLLENLGKRLSPDSFGTVRLFSERPVCAGRR